MKKLIRVITLLIIASPAFAQHPVKWKFNSEESKQETWLKFTADIEDHWHIYSQFTPDGGPLPMLFTFDSSSCYQLEGKTVEPKQIEEYDSVFAVKVLYLERKPVLSQKLKISSTPCKVSGKIEYQACKDMCISLDTTFTFSFPGKTK